MQKDRPKANVTMRARYMLLDEYDLPPDTFKPLTNIATTLYVLGVTNDGALVNELQAKPKKTKSEDQEVYELQSATPAAPDPEPDFAQYQVVQEHPADFVLIRGLHQTAGWAVVKAFAPEHRSEAIDWLKQRGVDLKQVEGVTPAECGATSSVTTAGPLADDGAEAVRTFAIEVDGDLVRVDYDPKRQIGPDVCFDFHGPTVSATGYLTRFVAREPA